MPDHDLTEAEINKTILTKDAGQNLTLDKVSNLSFQRENEKEIVLLILRKVLRLSMQCFLAFLIVKLRKCKFK